MLFLAGLWPFNFNEKNNSVISPSGGLEIARHGTSYTSLPPGKLQDLKQFAIHIDLVTSSDGLNAFEKIFSYAVNQEEMNFLLGQWKGGLLLHLRNEKQIQGIKFGSDDALKKEERTQCLITYDGTKMIFYQDGKVKRYRETGPLNFSNWDGTYPLVVGTDAGGRSQWRGTLYEVAVFDRALTSEEVKRLSSLSGLSGLSGHAAERQGKKGIGLQASGIGLREEKARKQENPPLSPFTKGGSGKGEIAAERREKQVISGQWSVTSDGKKKVVSDAAERQEEKGVRHPTSGFGTKDGHRASGFGLPDKNMGLGTKKEENDTRPLIHYVFRPENTKTVTSGQWPVASEKKEDKRPLIHYVFKEEHTYQTTYRGGKALGVRDLGKGEAADLVMPEQFAPYQRVYLGWDPDWMKNRSDWLDLAVNILGFIPFGALLFVQSGKWVLGIGNKPQATSHKPQGNAVERQGFGFRASGVGIENGNRASGFGIKEENPPVSPFMKGGGLVVAVVLAVVVGFVVSFAIEWLQAYLPSRDSSMRDLITNGLGTFIGAIVAAYLLKRARGSGQWTVNSDQ